jgi:hypothetical protein
MERELHDVSTKDLSPDEINEMEDRRIAMLKEAGVDEVDVLEQCNKNLNTWNSYFNENIVRGKDDMNFVLRDQWTAVERSEFTRLFKPAMTVNKLYDSTKKIAGEQRKNKPDLIVRSLTGKATQEQINLRADLVRTISYQSQNDLVYQTAFKSALMMGFGAFQVCVDFESPRSFNKIIRYDLIPDPTMCSWDPTAIKPHKGDGNFCSRRYVYTRDEFFATYPYVLNPVSYVDPYMLLDFQWQTRNTIVVCDEFVKEWFPLIIYKLSNGMVVDQWQWKEAQESYKMQKKITEGSIVAKIIENGIPNVIGERQTQDYKIMHYRMIRDRIIDFSEWPSRQLPIPFVDGDSYYIEGRQYTKSFVHEARDAQKALNYSFSETMAEIKNRRREQWIGTPDNIIGYEQQWRNPELQMGILTAKPDPKTGLMPEKMQAWDISQGLFSTTASANQNIKEILGFSEQEHLLGKDMSGKARRERKLEGSMSAYVFFDNLNQAIEQGGRVVNDLLPYIIGEDERYMVVSKPNGKTESIILNHMQSDGTKKNIIDDSDYDVEIDTGPSFAVQKDMAIEFLQQTLQVYPQAFPLVADLWVKNLDVQFMQQMADRFETIVPPQILAKEQGKQLPPQPPSPEEKAMQMQQEMMQQEMKIKEAQLQERATELAIRQKKHELEQAQLILDARKMEADMEMDRKQHHADLTKADLDFTAKIAKILADSHAKTQPQK